MRTKKVTKGILWQGLSPIDNAPIACVIVGGSANSKTGDMVQTFIIRTDVDPITANRLGLDSSICGNCRHRGIPDNTRSNGYAKKRSCYVDLRFSVMAVYRALKRGSYPVLSAEQVQSIVQDKMVRIGSYGDGAMVPNTIWDNIRAYAKGVTAYTHQGLTQSDFYMQSADTIEEAKTAWNKGKRTFRVIPIESAIQSNEILCPSSKGVTCNDCGLCDGSKRAKSIAIVAHGIGANNYRNSLG